MCVHAGSYVGLKRMLKYLEMELRVVLSHLMETEPRSYARVVCLFNCRDMSSGLSMAKLIHIDIYIYFHLHFKLEGDRFSICLYIMEKSMNIKTKQIKGNIVSFPKQGR